MGSVITELSSTQILIMSCLYLNENYPYNFASLSHLARITGKSKGTVLNLTRDLIKKKLITCQNSYISFYYPVKNDEVVEALKVRLGLIS